VLGIEGLAADPAFAGTVAERTLGASGSRILRGAMAVSALGVCAVTIIASPWMYVAMAREGLFFARFAALHPRTGAPLPALAVQALLCLAYWFWGQAGEAAKAALPAGSAEAQRIVTPEVLVSSVAFVEWIFHALVALALLRLRATRPDLARPFRAWTAAPLVYLAFALVVVFGNLAQANVRDSSIGLGLIALGAVVYLPWRALCARPGA
jgi:basic amino acid/polyamine antiporter, APA family